MNTIAYILVTGTSASLIAVLIVELFLYLKRKLLKWKIKMVLGVIKDGCNLILPTKDHDLIKYYDTNASSYVFGLINQLNGNINFKLHNQINEDDDVLTEFCIGSPENNQVVAGILKDYIDQNIFKPVYPTSIGSNLGFRIIGLNELLKEGGGKDYAILAKIKWNDKKNIFVISGLTDKGTAGAAFYFFDNCKTSIYKKYRNREFCMILEIPTNRIKMVTVLKELKDWKK